jgi:hypothetical protein
MTTLILSADVVETLALEDSVAWELVEATDLMVEIVPTLSFPFAPAW